MEGEAASKITVSTTETEFTYSGSALPAPLWYPLSFVISMKTSYLPGELPENFSDFWCFFIKQGFRVKRISDFQVGITFLVETFRHLY